MRYLESWLRGFGCVPLYDLMEDAATAEICRAQIWQWIKFKVTLDDGRPVTYNLVQELLADQVSKVWQELGPEKFNRGRYRVATDLLETMVIGTEFPDFLTEVAYHYLD